LHLLASLIFISSNRLFSSKYLIFLSNYLIFEQSSDFVLSKVNKPARQWALLSATRCVGLNALHSSIDCHSERSEESNAPFCHSEGVSEAFLPPVILKE